MGAGKDVVAERGGGTASSAPGRGQQQRNDGQGVGQHHHEGRRNIRPQGLKAQLQGHDAAEKPGSDYGAPRTPEGEDDQSYGNPAFPGGEIVRPHVRGAQGKIGSAQPHKEGSAGNADPAHPCGADPRGGNGIRIFPAGAQSQPRRGAVQEEPQQGRQNIGKINQRIMLEEHGAEQGDLPQQRKCKGLKAFRHGTHKGCAEIIRESDAENCQRQT